MVLVGSIVAASIISAKVVAASTIDRDKNDFPETGKARK
jgi:hypothetical protein